MASLMALTGRLVFKLDTGETKNGKPVYKSQSIANINADVDPDDLGAVAEKIVGLCAVTVDVITLQRYDVVVL